MVASAFPSFNRAKVILQEFDLSQITGSPVGTIGFLNGEFRKGSLKPRYIDGSIENFYKNYGDFSDPTLSFDHDTGVAFLAAKSTLLVNRVVADDAAHAALNVVIDSDTTYGKRMLFLPAQDNYGYTQGYEAGSAGITLLKFSTQLVTLNKFDMSISDGSTVTPVSVTFATSHLNTMNNIASAITTALSSYGTNGYAYVYTEPSAAGATPYTIVIVTPVDATLIYSGAAVTLGASQPTATLVQSSTCWLMTLYAENPGVWANDVGVKITQLNQGVRERYKLTISAAFVTSNSINMKINDVAITPVTYATSSDSTLAALAAAIQAHADVRSATVVTTRGGTANDRTILIEAETPGAGELIFTNAVVTSGASQPTISFATSLTGKKADGYFTLNIYERSSPNVIAESHIVTPYPFKNRAGEQTQYTSMNDGGSAPSSYIRAVVNPSLSSYAGYTTMLTTMMNENFAFRTTIAYLNGGDDGSNATTGQMISALTKFEDRIKYPFNIILNGGRTVVEYQQALVNLAETRNDCTAILDMPTTSQSTAQAARDYRLYDLNIDSSFGAMYSPDILVADLSTSEHRYIPPSGMVGAAYVYNDNVGARWSVPAGFNRGRLRQALGFRVDYSPNDEELLHPYGVNPLVDRPGVGPVIMGEQTLQTETSALSSVHIRRLMNMIETVISDALEYILFELHTPQTRYNVEQLCESVLSPVYRREGLYGYYIRCDETNNPPEVIDRDALAVDIYVKPVRAIKGILLRAFITRTGADFELIADQNTITI